MKRRERTRQLIELGGLVVKAGVVELTEDDRAVIYGALLNVAAKLKGEQRDQALLLWRRGGKRAFADDAEEKQRATPAQALTLTADRLRHGSKSMGSIE